MSLALHSAVAIWLWQMTVYILFSKIFISKKNYNLVEESNNPDLTSSLYQHHSYQFVWYRLNVTLKIITKPFLCKICDSAICQGSGHFSFLKGEQLWFNTNSGWLNSFLFENPDINYSWWIGKCLFSDSHK